jgi:hypothetical protein
LIGVHTWFISLILVCYVAAVLIHWNRRLFPAVVAVLLLAVRHEDPKFIGCVLAFLTGGSAALALQRQERLPRSMAWLGISIRTR